MHSQRHAAQQLNYFQQSPVRGQLEPSDGFSRTGWRYLQCTETPNELRVLLPPRTALIYSHLLTAETVELAKDKAASWDRIMQIRHLKDRMIRKCQRLARASTPKEKSSARVMYFTMHAPPDFRLKEMERWFRSQGAELAQIATDVTATPCCCSKCGPLPNNQTTRRPPAVVGRSTHSTRGVPDRVPKRPTDASNATQHKPSPALQLQKPQTKVKTSLPPSRSSSIRQLPAVLHEQEAPMYVPPPKPAQRARSVSPSHELRTHTEANRANLKSPDPVPIPYRPREPEQGIEVPVISTSPPSIVQEAPKPSSPASTLVGMPQEQVASSNGNGQCLETINEKSDGFVTPARPQLLRRRSSLKNRNSMSRLSMASQTKSVSWAMDKDWVEQMAKYVQATKDAEAVAFELEKVRAHYHEHMARMRELCRNVAAASERIRMETANLHRDEFAVQDLEAKLLASCEEVEEKESQYREKVIAVLEETNRVVQLCDKKRDIRDS